MKLRSLIIAALSITLSNSDLHAQTPEHRKSLERTEWAPFESISLEAAITFSEDRRFRVSDVLSMNDDRQIVVSDGSSPDPGTIYAIDMESHWRISRSNARNGFVSLSRLKNEVISTAWDDILRFHEFPSMKPRLSIPVDPCTTRVAAALDGRLFGLVREGFLDRDESPGRSVSLYAGDTGQQTKVLTTDLFRALDIRYSPDSRYLAVCGGVYMKPRGGILAWDTITGEKKIDVDADSGFWRQAYADGGKWLVATGTSGTVIIDTATGKKHQTAETTGSWIIATGDGKFAIVATGDRLTVLDIPDLKVVKTISSEHGPVEAMAMLDSGKQFLTANSSSIRIWNCSTWTSELLMPGRTSVNFGTSLVTIPGSGLLALANGNLLRIFEAKTGLLWNTKEMPADIRRISTDFAGQKVGLILKDGNTSTVELASGKVRTSERPVSQPNVTLSRDLTMAYHTTSEGELIAERLNDGSRRTAPKVTEKITSLVIAASGDVCCGLASGDVVVFDENLSRIVASIPKAVQSRITCLDWSGQLHRLAVGDDKGVTIWDIDSKGVGRSIVRKAFSSVSSTIALSHRGDRVAVGFASGGVAMMSLIPEEMTQPVVSRAVQPIISCVWSEDDHEILTANSAGRLGRIVLKSRPISATHSLEAPDGVHIQSVCMSLNGDECFLAIGDKIEVRSTKSWEVKQVLDSHTAEIHRVRISPDGKRLASTGGDSLVQIYNRTDGVWEVDRSLFLPAHGHRLEWSPDGTMLIVGLVNPNILIYDTKSWEKAHQFSPPFIVNSFSFSTDGRMLAGAGFHPEPNMQCKIRVWDTTTWKDLKEFNGHRWGIEGISFSADGKHVFSTSADSELQEWSMEDGTNRKITNLPMSGTSLSLLPNPKYAVASWHFANLGIVDLTDGTIIATTKGHNDQQQALMRDHSVSPDGEWAASCAISNLGRGTGVARLWRIGRGLNGRNRQ